MTDTDHDSRHRMLRFAELFFLALGCALCAFYVSAQAQISAAHRADLRRFERARAALEEDHLARGEGTLPTPQVEMSLWSESRIRAYESNVGDGAQLPIAVLEIPAIGLEVQVLEGTDDQSLNRGVGHIEGSAFPGQPGNVAIAGHRDGFFRGLKDLKVGDVLVLTTLEDRRSFVVRDLSVVSPDDVSVLEPTASPTLTLVTCYPFYFVGGAPSRFVVTANGTHHGGCQSADVREDDSSQGRSWAAGTRPPATPVYGSGDAQPQVE